jgi:membrane-bound metal-dependent hydrolase YbcI (DUF457 family)
MPDLFTHVLVGYTIAVVLSWQYEWLGYPFVAVTMAGAILPDLSRLDLLVPAATIETTFAVPFSWIPLHRAGGTLLVVCLGGLLAPKRYRRAVFALLFAGAASHYLLDFFLYKPSGVTGPLLWPFVTDGFVIDGFYRSSDRWPAVVATAGVLAVRFVERRWIDASRSDGSS